jgi:hypothetical protein
VPTIEQMLHGGSVSCRPPRADRTRVWAQIVFTSLMGVRDGATASLNLKHVVTIKHNSAISFGGSGSVLALAERAWKTNWANGVRGATSHEVSAKSGY